MQSNWDNYVPQFLSTFFFFLSFFRPSKECFLFSLFGPEANGYEIIIIFNHKTKTCQWNQLPPILLQSSFLKSTSTSKIQYFNNNFTIILSWQIFISSYLDHVMEQDPITNSTIGFNLGISKDFDIMTHRLSCL